jgi:tRNA splicing endonuclease
MKKEKEKRCWTSLSTQRRLINQTETMNENNNNHHVTEPTKDGTSDINNSIEPVESTIIQSVESINEVGKSEGNINNELVIHHEETQPPLLEIQQEDTQSPLRSEVVMIKWENRIQIVREHFQRKGYRVHSGLQFGCELVLYADDPSRVHSDFCVHVVPEGMYYITLLLA